MKDERLALVNSSMSVLRMLEDVLRDEHVIVFKVSSEAEFERRLNSGKFDDTSVVILEDDVHMPGMGRTMADRLRNDYPGIKIVTFAKELQDWGDKNLLNSPNTTNKQIRQAILDLR